MNKLGYNSEMDERQTTERILDRMTDPEEIRKRELKKKQKERVNKIKSKISV